MVFIVFSPSPIPSKKICWWNPGLKQIIQCETPSERFKTAAVIHLANGGRLIYLSEQWNFFSNSNHLHTVDCMSNFLAKHKVIVLEHLYFPDLAPSCFPLSKKFEKAYTLPMLWRYNNVQQHVREQYFKWFQKKHLPTVYSSCTTKVINIMVKLNGDYFKWH